ncbi:outer membrane beta-barrel protein [Thalassotalea fonticola]|uniref:Outer membrane beta-barrel protein n=1 Tax=Thalassotalea fonticola TaxID=3065649 RepID=A0ABZ0GPB2_9GAMM|nr:outer membrane beta-barrel protein [Colwelliaceae bacterium S1-1]
MTKNTIRSLFLVFSIFSCSLVMAEVEDIESIESNSHFYIGVTLGKASSEETFHNVFTLMGNEYSKKDDNTALGLYAGYNFADKWSLEGGVIFVSHLNKRPSPQPIEEVYLTVFTFTPIIYIDLNDDLSLFVKAGLGVLIYSEDYHKHNDIFSLGSGDSWAGGGLALGAGIEMSVSSDIEFRFGYDYIKAELEADEENHLQNLTTIDEEFSLISLSFHYKF